MTLHIDVERRLGAFHLCAKFECGPGVTALFGRSGAGKRTLINMITGLVRPERGRIVATGKVLFDSAAGTNVPVHKRRIGYVFQEGRLFPHLTVRHNLLFGRWFTRASERYIELEPVVEMLGIGHLLDRRPGALSGGEKQRVAIGRALLASPRLLLMDEPLAALDAARKEEILPYIERLRDETRVPIVYVSHAIEEVARLANTLVLMADGKVAAAGPVTDLMSRLDLRPITGRYESGAVVEAEVTGQDTAFDLTRLSFVGGGLLVPRIDVPVGRRVRIRIRDRDVSVAIERPHGLSTMNVVPCRIVEIADADGPFAELRLDAGGAGLVARITKRSAHDLALVPGRDVFAVIKSISVDSHNLSAAPEG
jgi:molybdate transport system ATP-binding protein